jgi:hypothetical protein
MCYLSPTGSCFSKIEFNFNNTPLLEQESNLYDRFILYYCSTGINYLVCYDDDMKKKMDIDYFLLHTPFIHWQLSTTMTFHPILSQYQALSHSNVRSPQWLVDNLPLHFSFCRQLLPALVPSQLLPRILHQSCIYHRISRKHHRSSQSVSVRAFRNPACDHLRWKLICGVILLLHKPPLSHSLPFLKPNGRGGALFVVPIVDGEDVADGKMMPRKMLNISLLNIFESLDFLCIIPTN